MGCHPGYAAGSFCSFLPVRWDGSLYLAGAQEPWMDGPWCCRLYWWELSFHPQRACHPIGSRNAGPELIVLSGIPSSGLGEVISPGQSPLEGRSRCL